MKTKDYIIIFAVVILSGYWFWPKSTNNEKLFTVEHSLEDGEETNSEEQDELPEEESEIPIEAEQAGTFSQQPTITTDLSKDLTFKLENTYSYELSDLEHTKLTDLSLSKDDYLFELDQFAKNLSANRLNKKKTISLAKLPVGKTEAKNWFAGLNNAIMQKLFIHIDKPERNYKQITAHLYTMKVLKFLSALEFEGYSDHGSFVYRIPQTEVFAKKEIKKRTIASPLNLGLFNFKSGSKKFTESEEEALFNLKSQQTKYGGDLSGTEKRKNHAVEDDPLTSDFFNLLESTFIKPIGSVGMGDDTPEAYLEQVKKMFRDLPEDLQRNPKRFGLTQKRYSNLKNINLTEVNFNILLGKIINRNSLIAAGFTGAFSAVLGESVFEAIFAKVPLLSVKYKLVLPYGVEPLFVSNSVYKAMKSSYVLHRYYSYLMGAKQASELKGEQPDFEDIIEAFDPKTIVFDEYFRRETIRAIVKAFITGIAIKHYVKKDNLKEGLNKINFSDFTKGKSARFKEVYNSTKAGAKVKLYKQSISKLKTGADYLKFMLKNMAGKLKMDRKEKPDKDKKLSNKEKAKAVSALGKLSTKLVAAGPMMLLDFAFTFPVVYMSTYKITSQAVLSITETDLSPSASIQRSLFTATKGDIHFLNATREVLYPICRYLSTYNAIEYDPVRVEKKRVTRQQACLNLIRSIEGFSSNEQIIGTLNDETPNGSVDYDKLYEVLTSKTLKKVDRKELEHYLEQSFKYPIDYRITWLSALRSIFSLTHIPKSYREVKNAMILKDISPKPEILKGNYTDSWRKTSVGQTFWLTPSQISSYRNLYRLNYTIELLATDTYISEAKTNRSKLLRTDPEIAKNVKELSSAWINYVGFQKERVTSYAGILNSTPPLKEERGYFRSLGRSGLAILNQAKASLSMITSGSRSWGMVGAAEEEVSTIRRLKAGNNQ